jgi:hypothetical protein
MVFSIQKEANFMKAVQEYKKVHGRDFLYFMEKPKSKKSVFPKSVELTAVQDADVDEYQANVQKALRKHPELYSAFKGMFAEVEALIYRYDFWGYLDGNISLSVHPNVKKRWGITHELFGAFYNVDLTKSYCSLFPDLEPGSEGSAMSFKPEKGDVILANPPYTDLWITWLCRKILDTWRGKATFYVVIPAWDCKTRDELTMSDMKTCYPDIVELIENADEYKLYRDFPFYNGIERRDYSFKKDRKKDVPIHVIKI